MSKNITLKDKSGNQLLPLTTSTQVIMSNNITLETAISDIQTTIRDTVETSISDMQTTLNSTIASLSTSYMDLTSNQTVTGLKTFNKGIIASQFKSDSTEAGMYFGENNELDFGSNGNTLYIGYANRLGTTGTVSQWWFGRSNGSGGWRSGDIHCGSINLFSTSTNKSWKASQNVNGDLVFTLE